ncbi:shikimate dehydrogenase [Ramlibacter sp. USB13]|uniref:shikimate dehydrogenase (NADP(+)) n=1 Tax=Ramlibacter cellulosilyticus TaxID=2764187 RepID=A0A923SE69_9BURK|nr:shikimate dehydrogenase [Ramlibacter cellulosilyticus]MBC5786028.1 shikimate dehydrogenase [Ramlibacter cellulosilyticus]
MGNPVDHSKSPWIHARFAQLTGEPVEYGKRLIGLDEFPQAVRAFIAEGGKGCNITVPFKFQAASLVTARSARAELAEACNILTFRDGGILGDNTDGIGFVADVERNAGVPLAGRDVLLLGAGGAAAGVLGPVLEARPRRVVVANRTFGKARALVERHASLAASMGVELSAAGLDAVPGTFDVMVNGTASSLGGGGVPVDARVLKPGALAYDMMYGPAAEGFLRWAREHGATGRDGLGMLVEQAAEAFLIWRGMRPPSAQVLAELREELAR